MNKAKVIAISAMCSAVALGCLLLAALPAMNWAMLILGVIASIALVIPIMISPANLPYTLLAYLASSALGVFLGMANIVYVAPIVTFCVPFAIVKVWGETVKVTAKVGGEQVLQDPFGGTDDKKLVAVEVNSKQKLPVVVRWVLYYILLEVGLGLTLLATYLFSNPVFQTLVTSTLFWVLVGVLQLAVFPYNVLMSGCLSATYKILQKAIKLE